MHPDTVAQAGPLCCGGLDSVTSLVHSASQPPSTHTTPPAAPGPGWGVGERGRPVGSSERRPPKPLWHTLRCVPSRAFSPSPVGRSRSRGRRRCRASLGRRRPGSAGRGPSRPPHSHRHFPLVSFTEVAGNLSTWAWNSWGRGSAGRQERKPTGEGKGSRVPRPPSRAGIPRRLRLGAGKAVGWQGQSPRPRGNSAHSANTLGFVASLFPPAVAKIAQKLS